MAKLKATEYRRHSTDPVFGSPCKWLILKGPDKFFDKAVGTMGTDEIGVALNSVAIVTTSNSKWWTHLSPLV